MRIPTLMMAAAARCAAAALAALLIAGCANDSPDQLMASAKEYLAKGDRNAALIQLKNLLAKAPDNGEARLLLGQAQLDAGDAVSAEKELARALQLKQPQEKVVPLYVRSLLAQGKLKEAIAEGQKFRLFDNAAVATTQTALGDAYRQLGNREQAAQAYEAATAAVPNYSRARLGTALLLAGEGQGDAALKQADEVIAADPKLVEARLLRAEILLARGDRAGARKTLEEAIAAEGRFLPARLALIRLLADERSFDAAGDLIASSGKVAPGDLRVTYLDAAVAYLRGDTGRSRQQVQQVLKLLPDHVPSLVLVGRLDLREGQLPAAEANLRRALARTPSHHEARTLLVRTYLRMGLPAKARDALQPLVDAGLTQSPTVLLLAGATYLANGDLKRAAEFYQAAARTGGNEEVVARTRLGQIALATGRSDAGFKELETAAEADPASYEADLAIISGHLRRNELDKAMLAAKALERKQPNNPITYQMYGIVNIAKENLPAARTNFERALQIRAGYLPAASSLAQLDVELGRSEDARKRYESMIAADPTSEHLYVLLAELQTRTGADAKEVVTTLQRGVQASQQSPTPRLALIEFQLLVGDVKAALTSAQAALAAMPSDARVVSTAAAAQEAAGDFNQAVGSYQKLASLQPHSTEPLYRMAALHLRQREIDKAIDLLRRIQRISPRDRDAVLRLVTTFVGTARYDDALKEARAQQQREPKSATGWWLEGDVFMAQQKYADAERQYRESLRVEPNAGAGAVGVHKALVARGNAAAADAWSRKWIAENPRDTTMRMYLAQRGIAGGDLKVAAAHYQAVLATEPNNVRALNNLAWIGSLQGTPKAIEYAARAATLAPSDSAVLDTYGSMLLANGESMKALPYLQRAHWLDPTRNEVRLKYAKALIQVGRTDSARRELQTLQGVKEDFGGKDEVAGLLRAL